jgi:hypothetical protein
MSITFNTNTGSIKSDNPIKVAYNHTCSCGNKFTVDIDWHKGLTMNTSLNIPNVECPMCKAKVVSPRASYSEKDGVIIAD